MGLSAEGYRTGGKTVLRVDLIFLRKQPSEEEVLSAMRAMERNKRALPLFRVKWFPSREGGAAYSSNGWLGEAGAFGLLSEGDAPTLMAAQALGVLWVNCLVEGGEEEEVVENKEEGEDA